MSRGSQENNRVRHQITEALFSLMAQKQFSTITASEIITEADVARASYYRNFGSKEDIINEWVHRLHDELQPADTLPQSSDTFTYENMATGFERSLNRFLSVKRQVLVLYDNGFASLLQNAINSYTQQTIGKTPLGSIEKYRMYFIAGAVANVLIAWLRTGAIESPRTIAQACAGWFFNGITR